MTYIVIKIQFRARAPRRLSKRLCPRDAVETQKRRGRDAEETQKRRRRDALPAADAPPAARRSPAVVFLPAG